MCTIVIPPELVQHCEGKPSIDCISAGSIGEVSAMLLATHPALSEHLFGRDGAGGGWIFAVNDRVLTAADRLGKEDSIICLKVLYGG